MEMAYGLRRRRQDRKPAAAVEGWSWERSCTAPPREGHLGWRRFSQERELSLQDELEST